MNLMLKIVGPDGEVTELPIDDARLEIVAIPGNSYRLVGEQSQPQGKPAQAGSSGPRALRIDDDLLLDQLEGGYPVTLTDFFSNCGDGNHCELVIEIDGREPVTLTPASEPLAAYAEGGFLMYLNDSSTTVAQALPQAPESEIQFDWRPWAAAGGGLLIVAGAAGGSGSTVGSDTTSPSTPTIDSGTQTNSPTPVFSGKADPNSTIQLTVQVGDGAGANTANYSTQADALGNWSINTRTDTPTAGQFPALGIQEGQTAAVSMIATDSSGNLSAPVSSQVVFDSTPPEQPVIATLGDLAPGANGVVVINKVESADGIQIQGTAEAGSTVNVALAGAGYTFAEDVQVDASGRFSVNVPVNQAPPDGSDLTLSVTATDQAGNVSAPSQTNVAIDTSVSDVSAIITIITDNAAPQTGTVTNGVTNDATPTIRGSISGQFADGDTLQVLRDGDLIGSAQVSANGAAWAFTDNLAGLPAGAEGEYSYQVRVADAAGNTGVASAAVALTVDQTNPTQQASIDTVIDDNGSRPVTVSSGGRTDDDTPTLRISLSDVLGQGESLNISRSQAGRVTVVAELTAQDAINGIYQFEDDVVGFGTIGYQAQVVDSAGLASDPSSVYAIRLINPIEIQP